jgi:outer membrane receptor protein involved in Fe transport
MRKKRLAKLLERATLSWLLGFLIFALAPPASGQNTLSVLVGQVVDVNGNPMPGVTITLTAKSKAMAPAGVVTDASGNYRIAPLAPGTDYLLVAELPGYARVEVGPVDLSPGKTTTVNLSLLSTSETTERVEVIARGDMVDLGSTKTSTLFRSEFIEGLPIIGRTYQSILTLAPGVTDIDGDGNPNVNGARANEFQTRVDGANATDPLTGGFGQNLNIEAIADLEVITAGASAEFSAAQGGFANILTKSGGNDFSGSFKFFFRSDLFDNDGANNNDATTDNLFDIPDGFQDIRSFLTLGGPIVKNHLWYFVALQYISTETPILAGTQAFLEVETGWNNFGKISWQASPSHRLAFQLSLDPRRFEGMGLGTGIAPESDFFLDTGGWMGTIRWTASLSPTVLLETLVSRLDIGLEILPVSDPRDCLLDPSGRCNPFSEDLFTFDQRVGFITGPYFETHRDDRIRNSVRTDLSMFLDTDAGTHNLKTGVEFAREDYENRLIQETQRIDNFAFVRDEDTGIGSLEGTVQFRDFLARDQVRTAKREHFGFYVQDTFKPLPNLSLQVGLRIDRDESQTRGWTPFDPEQEANAFLDLLAIGQGVPREELDIADAFLTVGARFLSDINGDGRDGIHCNLGMDLYTNSTVTDFVVEPDGTYTLVGEPVPDGILDNFFNFLDGDEDGTANFGDPDDLIGFFPGGFDAFGSNPDGRANSPNCDRTSEDLKKLFSVYSRHQLDFARGPINFDDGAVSGTFREEEDFEIVNNNLAPRLSVSWDPWGNNKTKIFAFWGRFYGTLYLASLVPELGPDDQFRTFDASVIAQGANAQPFEVSRFSATLVDRDIKTPFTDEFTLGFERELSTNWLLSFTYINRKGRDQLQDVDVNHFTADLNKDGLLDDNFGIPVPPSACSGDVPCNPALPDGLPDLYSFTPFFGQVLLLSNFNSSKYESFQFAVTRRLSRRWQMIASYANSRAEGDAETFDSILGNDLGNVDEEEGPLDFDQAHVLKASAVGFLPGNQTIGTIVQWSSGLPYSVVFGPITSADSFQNFQFRTTFPSGQRNDQRNESVWLINASYRKFFSINDLQLALGVEVENLLNTDDLRVLSENQSFQIGVDSVRAFGRRWQLSVEITF